MSRSIVLTVEVPSDFEGTVDEIEDLVVSISASEIAAETVPAVLALGLEKLMCQVIRDRLDETNPLAPAFPEEIVLLNARLSLVDIIMHLPMLPSTGMFTSYPSQPGT